MRASVEDRGVKGEQLPGYYELAEVLLRMRASVEDRGGNRGGKGEQTPGYYELAEVLLRMRASVEDRGAEDRGVKGELGSMLVIFCNTYICL